MGKLEVRLTIAILSLLLSTGVRAQYYTSGEAPASVKWQQINTSHFKIVFPSYYAGEAKKLAAIMDSSIYYTSVSMGRMPSKLNVLVHAQSAYSNGFVSWAPKRMELYPTPPQNGNTQDWLSHLAIHEQRHLVQIDQLNQGFTKWMGYLFGQQATGAMIGIHFPMWLMEGDAVLTETLLTESGRGRMPWFSMPLKAQMLEKGIYGYDKAYLGSYRSFVPDYYVMGYHFVTGARQWYGHDIWQKVASDLVPNAWYPFQFSRQIMQYSGHNKIGLYAAVYDSLKTKWANEDTKTITTPFTQITRPDKSFKNYLYAQPSGFGTWIAEVDGPGQVNRFVEIAPNGKEHTVAVPGYRNDEPFSYKAQRMVWSEQKDHLRWTNASVSVVRMYDSATKNTKAIGPKNQRLFSPDLSLDGRKIVAVKLDKTGRSSLIIWDIEADKEIKHIDFGQGLVVGPKWMDTDTDIVFMLQNEQGKRIVILNTQTQDTSCVYGPSLNDIRHLQCHGNSLLFAKSENNKENIYQLGLQDHTIKQLTSERFGAASPFIVNDSLFYSRYTSDGYQLAKTVVSEVNPPQNQHLEPLFAGLEKWEKGKPDFTDLDTSSYQINNYSKWHLFNVHSWAPAYIDLSNEGITNGISIMSQNLLNTFFLQAGYNADPNYQTEKYNVKLSYKGWFPELNLTFKASDADLSTEGYFATFYQKVDTFYKKIDATQYYYQIQPGVNIPMNFSSGAWTRYVSPSARYIFNHQTGYDYQYANAHLLNGRLFHGPVETRQEPSIWTHDMEYDLFAYQLRRGTQRDVATRWGQIVEINYRNTLYGDVDRGTQLALLTRLYFPGIGRHHAIHLENNLQTRTDGDVYGQSNGYEVTRYFSSVVQMPRGYETTNAQKLYSLRSDYKLPLLNPDLSVGGLMYIKRLTASLFYDYSYATYIRKQVSTGIVDTKSKSYQSFGTDLNLIWHPARFIFPVSTGWRIAYLPNEKQVYNEFLINLNVSGFVSGRK